MSDSANLNKIKSDIIEKLENSTSKSFVIQMVLATVITYLSLVAVMIFIDLLLFESTVGGINAQGLILYFLSLSLITFIPIAIISTVIVIIMTIPILKIMKRYEKGETVTQGEFFAAKKRSAMIPQIIFIVNIIFPVILSLVSRSFDGSISQGLIILAKDVSIFTLAALVQNALYQRVLARPRAIMKIYSIDESANNWFIKNMGRLQLYASILFITAVLFHSAITVVNEINPDRVLQGQTSSSEQTHSGEPSNNSFQKIKKTMNKVISGNESRDALSTDVNYSLLFFLMGIICIGLIGIVDVIVNRARQTQVRILHNVLHDMASGSGDLTQRVLIVQADDNGILSHQLNMVLNRLQKMFRSIYEQTELVAESSRAVSSVLEETVAATEEMAASVSQINTNTARNKTVVLSSRESLENMLNSIDQINVNVNTQASYVEQTSSAMTEMIANIQSVNEVTKKANEVSEALKTVSDDGGQAVLNSITAVKDIEESSNEVNSLVQIISRILAATNMLAMNAAIEAAHAGEAGRGFAVVAEEVRNLADDSSTNLKTISENIKNVIDRVNRGVELSETAGKALSEVSDKTNQTARLMNEVASAMQEQSAGANEVLSSINSLVEASSSINKLSEEQHHNNELMKDNLEKTVNAFAEVQSATAELELGNREILNGIEELKEVINKNEQVVSTLQKELGGFKI